MKKNIPTQLKLVKFSDKEIIFKAVRVNEYIIYRGIKIGITDNFLWEIMHTEREWDNIIKVQLST